MPDNRKPLIYGAFSVCRNYTVVAHLRNTGAPEWRGCKDGVLHAGTLRCGLHPPHLHPCHTADAAKSRRKDGGFHGTGSIIKETKKCRTEHKIPCGTLYAVPNLSLCGSRCGSDRVCGKMVFENHRRKLPLMWVKTAIYVGQKILQKVTKRSENRKIFASFWS